MSTTTCKHCGNEGKEWEYYKGDYCNHVCYYREQGQQLLKKFEQDHKYCASCGRQLKEVSLPSSAVLRGIKGLYSKDAIVGYQYPTKDAGFGIKGRKGVDRPGIICDNCGTTHHKDGYFRDKFSKTFLKNLMVFVQELYDLGEIDKRLAFDEFVKDIKNGHTVSFSLGANLK